MRATQLLLAAGHLFLRHQQLLVRREEPPASCEAYTTPCGCTVDGCGWSSRLGKCIEGETTDCMECPNVLMCGDETCVATIYQDKEVEAALRKGKRCMDDGNDMAVCLCDDVGDLLVSKLEQAGCCDANEMFAQVCHQRECDGVPRATGDPSRDLTATESCGDIDEPCACGLRAGCGWTAGACVEGGVTACDECPHTLLCGSSTCAGRTFRNPDFIEAINPGKVCMESLRPTDTFETCIEEHGADLRKVIDQVSEDFGKDCCGDNKFFSMVCQKNTGPVSAKAGEGEPCDGDDACQDGLICGKDNKCHKPFEAGEGPCGEDGDCADGLECGDDHKCKRIYKEGEGPCEDDDDCDDDLVCGDDKKCHQVMKEGEGPCDDDSDCEDGLICGDDNKCRKPFAEGEGPCDEDGDCEDGLVCGENGTCVAEGADGKDEKEGDDDDDKEDAKEGDADDDDEEDTEDGREGEAAQAGAGAQGEEAADGAAAGDAAGADADAADAAGAGSADAADAAGDDAAAEEGEEEGPVSAMDGINALNKAAKDNHGQTRAQGQHAKAAEAAANPTPCRKMESGHC